jgi:two-component system, NarL family, nitrate/nitrite response regulator NarL
MVNILIVDDHLLMRRIVREVIEQESDFTVVAEASNGFEAEEQATRTQPDVVLMDLDMPGCNGFEATERVLACSPRSRVVIFTASHEERHVLQAIQRGAIGYLTKDTDPEALLHAIRCAARNDLCIPGVLATPVLAQIRAIWRARGYFASRRNMSAFPYRTPRRTMPQASRSTQPASIVEATDVPAVPAEPDGEGGGTAEQPADTPIEAVAETTEGATGETIVAEQPAEPEMRPLTEREHEILDLMRQGFKNREIALMLEIAESTVHKHVQNIFEKLKARNRAEAIYLTSTEEFFYSQ